MSSSSKPHYEADPAKVRYDKESNRWTFKPRDFNIIWGNDKRYWNLPEPQHDQQQSSVDDTLPAELVQVCWFEVTGKTGTTPIKAGKYKIKFEVSKKEDAFGWNSPVYIIHRLHLLSRCLRQLILQKRKTPRLIYLREMKAL